MIIEMEKINEQQVIVALGERNGFDREALSAIASKTSLKSFRNWVVTRLRERSCNPIIDPKP